jgi:hypothetical protein
LIYDFYIILNMEETSKKEFLKFKNSIRSINKNIKTTSRIKNDLTKIFEKNLKNGIPFINPISKPQKNPKFFDISDFFPKKNTNILKFFAFSALGFFAYYKLFIDPTSIEEYKNNFSFFSISQLDKEETRTIKFPKEVMNSLINLY